MLKKTKHERLAVDYINLRITAISKQPPGVIKKFGKHDACPYQWKNMPANCIKVSTAGCPYTPADIAELIYQAQFGTGWRGISLRRPDNRSRKKGPKTVWNIVEECEIYLEERNGITYVGMVWKPVPYRKDRRKARRAHSLTRQRWRKGTKGSTIYWFVTGDEFAKPLENSWEYTDIKCTRENKTVKGFVKKW